MYQTTAQKPQKVKNYFTADGFNVVEGVVDRMERDMGNLPKKGQDSLAKLGEVDITNLVNTFYNLREHNGRGDIVGSMSAVFFGGHYRELSKAVGYAAQDMQEATGVVPENGSEDLEKLRQIAAILALFPVEVQEDRTLDGRLTYAI